MGEATWAAYFGISKRVSARTMAMLTRLLSLRLPLCSLSIADAISHRTSIPLA